MFKSNHNRGMQRPCAEALEPRPMLAAGQMDTSFGDNGKVKLDFGSYAIGEWEGKLLLIRRGGKKVWLERLNVNGSPDESFGTHGLVQTSLPQSTSSPWHLLISQSDGRFALYQDVPAEQNTSFAIFKPDGSPDLFVNGDGVLRTNINARWAPVAFQPDGDVIVANRLSATRLARVPEGYTLYRYNRNGSLDRAFGKRGSLDVAGRVTFLRAGRFISTVLTKKSDGNYRLALYRFAADGQIDADYGVSGEVSQLVHIENASNSPTESLFSVASSPDGEVVVEVRDSVTYFQDVWKDSSRFFTFSPEGHIKLSNQQIDSRLSGFHMVGMESNHKLILGLDNDHSSEFSDGQITGDHSKVARLMPDGSIDTSYGTGGFTETVLAWFILQRNETLLIISQEDTSLLRLLGDPLPPATLSLSSTGTLTLRGSDNAEGLSVTFRTSDGRIVARAGAKAIRSFAPSRVNRIVIDGRGGSDEIIIGAGVIGAYADGGDGNDTILGGDGDDTLVGGYGDDSITGGGGRDSLVGAAGYDYLFGGGGSDRLIGGDGIDRLRGGNGYDRADKDPVDLLDPDVESFL